MINLGASQLEAHLRQGFLDPERLGTITSVFINPVSRYCTSSINASLLTPLTDVEPRGTQVEENHLF